MHSSPWGRLDATPDNRLIYLPGTSITANHYFYYVADDGRGGLAKGEIKAQITPLGTGKAFPARKGLARKPGVGESLVNGTTVRVVSNLNDGGPGSLRQALLDSKTSTGGNIIVFTVGGTIRIYSQLSIPSNVTIAGETAPGPMGITIYGDEAEVKNAHDVVVRYVRFRDYDRNRLKNEHHTADTLEINGSDHVIVDHCSCAWGNDGTLDIWDSNHVTVQWTLDQRNVGSALAGHANRWCRLYGTVRHHAPQPVGAQQRPKSVCPAELPGRHHQQCHLQLG